MFDEFDEFDDGYGLTQLDYLDMLSDEELDILLEEKDEGDE